MQDEYTIPVCGLFIVWETSFPYDKNAPRGSHCSGMEECRLRDPPQAENPASQDSFLYLLYLPLRPRLCDTADRHINV